MRRKLPLLYSGALRLEGAANRIEAVRDSVEQALRLAGIRELCVEPSRITMRGQGRVLGPSVLFTPQR